MRYLLDTNVLSEPTKPQPNEQVMAWLSDLPVQDGFISVVSLAEIELGILRKGQTKRATELQAHLERVEHRFSGQILGVDRPVARTWSEITARAFRAGQPLGYADSWIAATAMTHRLTVVTRNVTDFQAAGVSIVTPWATQ